MRLEGSQVMKQIAASRTINRTDLIDKGGGLTPSKNFMSPIRVEKEILNSYPVSNF